MTYSGVLSLCDINLRCRRKSLIERTYCNVRDYTYAGLRKSLAQKRGVFNINMWKHFSDTILVSHLLDKVEICEYYIH